MVKANNNQEKFEFEHGWKYFELHATQRISLFRYYIVFFTLYITGIGFLLTKQCSLSIDVVKWFIIAVSAVFILITLIFWVLDCRNKKLIDIAQNSLLDFENEHLHNSKHQIFTQKIEADKNCTGKLSHTNSFRFLFIITMLSSIGLIGYSYWFIDVQKPCASCAPYPSSQTEAPTLNYSPMLFPSAPPVSH